MPNLRELTISPSFLSHEDLLIVEQTIDQILRVLSHKHKRISHIYLHIPKTKIKLEFIKQIFKLGSLKFFSIHLNDHLIMETLEKQITQAKKRNYWPSLAPPVIKFDIRLTHILRTNTDEENSAILKAIERLHNTSLTFQSQFELDFFFNEGLNSNMVLVLDQTLSKLSNLTKLLLYGSFTDDFNGLIQNLKKNNKKLTELGISSTSVKSPLFLSFIGDDFEGAQHLRSLKITNLEEVIEALPLCFKKIGKLTQLTQLELTISQAQNLEDPTLLVLSNSISKLQNLRTLDIKFIKSQSSSEKMALRPLSLFKAIGNLNYLEKLSLSMSGLGELLSDEEVEVLCTSLKNSPSLNHLQIDFSQSKVSKKGLLAFQKTISQFHQLENLLIDLEKGASIDYQVFLSFVESFTKLNSLSKLTLMLVFPEIDEAFIPELVKTLDSLCNRNLEYLCLQIQVFVLKLKAAKLKDSLRHLEKQIELKVFLQKIIQDIPSKDLALDTPALGQLPRKIL